MAGLRELKKQQARHRIVKAAENLFASTGIDNTTVEEIAASAEMSVATVYNYFGSKTALLLACVEDDTDEMIAQGSVILAEPGADPQQAVKNLFGVYLQHFTTWDRAVLREVMAATFQQGGDQLAGELVHMDERLLTQVTELLEHFETGDALNPDASAREAALLLISTMVTHVFVFLSIDRHNAQELTAQVARQVDLAFAGLANPTEREVS